MNDAQIRPARAADLPQVVGLIRQLADFEKLKGPSADDETRFAQHFAQHRFELLIAELDGRVIAYALYFQTYSTFLARPSLYLEDLFVEPQHRSRGLGARLLQTLAALAVERDCGRFEWTVLDWNVRAQAFYRSLGAAMLDEWRVCRVDGEALRALGRR